MIDDNFPPFEPLAHPALAADTRLFGRARKYSRECFMELAGDLGAYEPTGLLWLARFVAVAQAIREERLPQPAPALTSATDPGKRLDINALADELYDDLFAMLRGGGWLDCPAR